MVCRFVTVVLTADTYSVCLEERYILYPERCTGKRVLPAT